MTAKQITNFSISGNHIYVLHIFEVALYWISKWWRKLLHISKELRSNWLIIYGEMTYFLTFSFFKTALYNKLFLNKTETNVNYVLCSTKWIREILWKLFSAIFNYFFFCLLPVGYLVITFYCSSCVFNTALPLLITTRKNSHHFFL